MSVTRTYHVDTDSLAAILTEGAFVIRDPPLDVDNLRVELSPTSVILDDERLERLLIAVGDLLLHTEQNLDVLRDAAIDRIVEAAEELRP